MKGLSSSSHLSSSNRHLVSKTLNKKVVITSSHPSPQRIESVLSPFSSLDEHTIKRKRERKRLQDLKEIWKYIQCSKKGGMLDIYLYLTDMMSESSSDTIKDTANTMIEYLDSTCMRGS
ncbi:hypothetical protein DID78_03035 [Candidatus Marinamargulisbacteria bacterium SCGC AG-343-D04]|nr:hypothetical protein DID78_03035 [Candidatus Marinamargulisbacteria bacterium SCGC AG-343-D04]